MILIRRTFVRPISTTSRNFVKPGDVYKELWKSATGGMKYSKRHRKVNKYKPEGFDILKFGTSDIKFVGLNQDLNIKDRYKELAKHIKISERQDIFSSKTEINENYYLSKQLMDHNVRGLSGKKQVLRTVGIPSEFPNDTEFKDFNSVILMIRRRRYYYTGGKKFDYMVLVGIGNGRGVLGIGSCIDEDLQNALYKARTEATKNLYSFNLYDDHTIHHAVRSRYNNIEVAIDPKPRGCGLYGAALIKKLCELIGIQNLYTKCHGRIKNATSLTRCFIRGLASQETDQELADRKGCILAMKENSKLSPIKIVAIPTTLTSKKAEMEKNQIFDYNFEINRCHFGDLHKPKDIDLFKDMEKPKKVKREREYIMEILKEGI